MTDPATTLFTADDITDSTWKPNSTVFVFGVKLPDGDTGGAVVTDPNAADASHESVAAALNFHVAGDGFDAVVEQLKQPDGLVINPALFPAQDR